MKSRKSVNKDSLNLMYCGQGFDIWITVWLRVRISKPLNEGISKL